MSRNFILVLAFIGIALIGQPLLAQTPYQLPNDDTNCPANCRQIPWQAGSDIWNNGTLPTYPVGTTCTGLTQGNQTAIDNTSAINSCIKATSAGNAAYIPAGMYYINGTITLKAGVVLRGAGGGPGAQGTWMNCEESGTYCGDVGAGSTVTTLMMDNKGQIFSGYGGDFNSPIIITNGYTKGSTAITVATNPGYTGGYVAVSENQGDSDGGVVLSTDMGESGSECNYCGPGPDLNSSGASNGDGHRQVMSQLIPVTSVTGSGPYTINLGRPLYYTFKSSLNPAVYQMQPVETNLNEGVENMKIWGYGTSTRSATPFILLQGCVECWVTGVETYNTAAVSGDAQVTCEECWATEIRDSYFHFGQLNAGGEDYGIYFFNVNSDNKVENNVVREVRHALIQEGGGSGNVFLYNYVDDMFTDDLTYLGSLRASHGAHPYMDLYEGNQISHCGSDDQHGSSSHIVFFRNWCWGDATGNFLVTNGGNTGWSSTNASYGFMGLEWMAINHYYAAVGNVLGNPNLHTTWTGGSLISSSCTFASSRASPIVYGFGAGAGSGTGACGEPGSFDSATRSTAILHGNYDYYTQGVAYWDGGSDHTLQTSIYYSSEPSFMTGYAWPAFGPDLTPLTSQIPAQARYLGTGGGGPAPPTGLQATVH